MFGSSFMHTHTPYDPNAPTSPSGLHRGLHSHGRPPFDEIPLFQSVRPTGHVPASPLRPPCSPHSFFSLLLMISSYRLSVVYSGRANQPRNVHSSPGQVRAGGGGSEGGLINNQLTPRGT